GQALSLRRDWAGEGVECSWSFGATSSRDRSEETGSRKHKGRPTFGSAGAGNGAACNYKHSAPLEPDSGDGAREGLESEAGRAEPFCTAGGRSARTGA